MKFLIVIAALLLHKFVHFRDPEAARRWVYPYHRTIQLFLQSLRIDKMWVALLIELLLPILFLTIALFIFDRLFGEIGYHIVSLLVLWYCLGYGHLVPGHYQHKTVGQVLTIAYRSLFPLLFWFILFGPFIMTLYFLLSAFSLVSRILVEEDENQLAFIQTINQFRDILDWLPARLVGLCYALTGHFLPTIKAWVRDIFSGLSKEEALIGKWGALALDIESPDAPASHEDIKAALALTRHSLIVWVVAMALIESGILISFG